MAWERLKQYFYELTYWYGEITDNEEFTRDDRWLHSKKDNLLHKMAADGLLHDESFERAALTVYDMSCLIEHDTMAYVAPNDEGPDVARETRGKDAGLLDLHHLAWLFGIQSGIRPGSLWKTIDPRDDEGYEPLVWKDINLSRWSNGRFIVKVTFRCTKGVGNNTRVQGRKPLTLHFRTPTRNDMLPLSVPDRLLIELLNRGFLRDHDSAASLLSGREHFIRIHPQAMGLPVFAKANDPTAFIDKDAVNRHLRRREIVFGFPPEHTFYSFRTQTARVIERALGEVAAQKVIHHRPHGTTYHRHYDRGSDHVDLVGVLIEHTDGTFEDGTAELPAVVLRSDFARARVELELEPTRPMTKSDEKKFGPVYAAQQEELPHAVIEARKEAMGKCGLLQRLGRFSNARSPIRLFFEGMLSIATQHEAVLAQTLRVMMVSRVEGMMAQTAAQMLADKSSSKCVTAAESNTSTTTAPTRLAEILARFNISVPPPGESNTTEPDGSIVTNETAKRKTATEEGGIVKRRKAKARPAKVQQQNRITALTLAVDDICQLKAADPTPATPTRTTTGRAQGRRSAKLDPARVGTVVDAKARTGVRVEKVRERAPRKGVQWFGADGNYTEEALQTEVAWLEAKHGLTADEKAELLSIADRIEQKKIPKKISDKYFEGSSKEVKLDWLNTPEVKKYLKLGEREDFLGLTSGEEEVRFRGIIKRRRSAETVEVWSAERKKEWLEKECRKSFVKPKGVEDLQKATT